MKGQSAPVTSQQVRVPQPQINQLQAEYFLKISESYRKENLNLMRARTTGEVMCFVGGRLSGPQGGRHSPHSSLVLCAVGPHGFSALDTGGCFLGSYSLDIILEPPVT